jgi:polysaccharide export outer membrane protein
MRLKRLDRIAEPAVWFVSHPSVAIGYSWRTYLRFLVVLLGAIVLVGCASRNAPVQLNSYQDVPNVEAAAADSFVPDDYRIRAYDELRIDVYGEPELSRTDLPVSPTGHVLLPLVGEVVARGLTPAELSQRIASGLRTYIREPAVAVNVTEFTSERVTVQGSVRMPGVFPAMDRMSLMDAIALGQGLNDFSKEDEILVFREQGDQRFVARFDLGPIQAGQAVDPAILPGDIVVVGESESRRIFSDSLALLPAAVGIFIALIQ